jgi:hypothetical protein
MPPRTKSELSPAARRVVLQVTLAVGPLAVWQGAFFKPGRFVATAGKDEIWNRGACLVDARAHCGARHTPRNAAQASEKTRSLTGASIEVVEALSAAYCRALVPSARAAPGASRAGTGVAVAALSKDVAEVLVRTHAAPPRAK